MPYPTAHACQFRTTPSHTLQDITPGKIAFTKPTTSPEGATEQVALFKPADLREVSLKLRPGDKVEFSLAQQDPAAAGDLASDVVLVSRAASAAADGRPLMGCVISVKEGFGFIRWGCPAPLLGCVWNQFQALVYGALGGMLAQANSVTSQRSLDA